MQVEVLRHPTQRRRAPPKAPTGALLWFLRCTALVVFVLCLWLAVAVAWNFSNAATTRHSAVIAFFDPHVRDPVVWPEHLFIEEGEGGQEQQRQQQQQQQHDHRHKHAAGDGLYSHLSLLQYDFGRWRHPVRDVTFLEDEAQRWTSVVQRFFTQKKWNSFTLTSTRFFVVVHLVQLNYLDDVVLTVIERPTGRRWTYHGHSMLGMGLRMAPSSIDGCTEWTASVLHRIPLEHEEAAEDLSICYDRVDGVWRGSVSLLAEAMHNAGGNVPISLVFTVQMTDALAMLFPLDGTLKRPAYIHKAAGAEFVGKLIVGDEEHDLDGLAALDWTKIDALRETTWKRASFSAQGQLTTIVRRRRGNSGDPNATTAVAEPQEKDDEVVSESTAPARIGINLSADVLDYRGHSLENAIWINGTLFPLSGVSFVVPKYHKHRNTWHVRSLNPTTETVRLVFQPRSFREDKTDVAALLLTDSIQVYGLANITVEFRPEPDLLYKLQIDNAVGLMEDHRAIW